MILDNSSSLRFERSSVPSYVKFSHVERARRTKATSINAPSSLSTSLLSYPVILCKNRACVPIKTGRTLEFRNNSITRRSYAENPATSRITDRTNLVFVDWTPLRSLGRGAFGIGVVGCP